MYEKTIYCLRLKLWFKKDTALYNFLISYSPHHFIHHERTRPSTENKPRIPPSFPKPTSSPLLLDSKQQTRGKTWLFRRQFPKLVWTERPIPPYPCLPWWDWDLTVGGRVVCFFGNFIFCVFSSFSFAWIWWQIIFRSGNKSLVKIFVSMVHELL